MRIEKLYKENLVDFNKFFTKPSKFDALFQTR